MSFLQRARSIISMAGVWAFGWMLLTLPFNIWESLSLPAVQRLGFILRVTSSWGMWGVLSGASFAVLLSVAERRLTIHQLSGWRLAIWGALGACVLPALIYVLGPDGYALSDASPAYAIWSFGITAAYGAVSAVTMLRVARGRTSPLLVTPVNAARLPASDEQLV